MSNQQCHKMYWNIICISNCNPIVYQLYSRYLRYLLHLSNNFKHWCKKLLHHDHRVIILNRGSMFAFQWREFSPPLSSAHWLLQCYNRQKRDRRRYNSQGIPPQPHTTMAISQWAPSLEWRHTVTLHILVEKICIRFFLFYCEGMLPLVVLWLCDRDSNFKKVYYPSTTDNFLVKSSENFSTLEKKIHEWKEQILGNKSEGFRQWKETECEWSIRQPSESPRLPDIQT